MVQLKNPLQMQLSKESWLSESSCNHPPTCHTDKYLTPHVFINKSRNTPVYIYHRCPSLNCLVLHVDMWVIIFGVDERRVCVHGAGSRSSASQHIRFINAEYWRELISFSSALDSIWWCYHLSAGWSTWQACSACLLLLIYECMENHRLDPSRAHLMELCC